ncbi:ThuA domain-containing protein [Candidatus Poribacteria bacterium]|nr:ThuA domain-containing protein [Candidatus Poribacteria bacterium]MBT5533765.1 ThuA domain-containing protein [Candidatus Poribacteria bacterium]MBT5714156.1 ThuA domain-containing protein [Candidatus Poribacteria bacterium]MBT7098855.1 ThuA domain-containing protein [Candidatus Poribacteria bacterium]MBT7806943.1 ThuA domain-containing protein [Candidatus Poribacteria bacterium]
MIKTLLLTGANNHDWARSAPFCKDLLEATGAFEVDLTENPEEVLEDRAKLDSYALYFVDYNGPHWSEVAKTNFIETIRGGTGVTILHAADNGFPGWVEYEEICALLWREGTGHGAYHKFTVKMLDKEHVVTRGLPDMVGHPDELYHRMVHLHDAPYRTLAASYSDPATGGTGDIEPMVIVKNYGEGRVFHDILGHVWAGGGMDTFESAEFQRLLIRGCEWAATGSVTH